jgi:hypothetical protein
MVNIYDEETIIDRRKIIEDSIISYLNQKTSVRAAVRCIKHFPSWKKRILIKVFNESPDGKFRDEALVALSRITGSERYSEEGLN